MGQALEMCVHCDNKRGCDTCPDLHEWIIEHMNPVSEDYTRFLTLRHRVMNAIKRELGMDCSCKSYEGTFELLVSFPDYFEYSETMTNVPDFFMIRLHCYVLGPGRHYEWRGKTLGDALNKCEADINEWIWEVQ